MTHVDVLRVALSVAMIGAGAMHFVSPRAYERMCPNAMPYKRAAVVVSGLAEIFLGVLLLCPPERFIASAGIIALLVAVFPANVNMAVNNISPSKNKPLPRWMLWARLPLQAVFIAWAWYVR